MSLPFPAVIQVSQGPKVQDGESQKADALYDMKQDSQDYMKTETAWAILKF